MENLQEILQALRDLGVPNPTENQARNLALLVLEGYQVEIFRQELKKVKAMRDECIRQATQAIHDGHPFGNGRDGIIHAVTDAIRHQSQLPELTHTVRYMISAD